MGGPEPLELGPARQCTNNDVNCHLLEEEPSVNEILEKKNTHKGIKKFDKLLSSLEMIQNIKNRMKQLPSNRV